MSWSPPFGELKFNVDGAARGNLGPAGIGGVLRNSDGVVFDLFSKNGGSMQYTEAEVVVILEALHIFTSYSF